jgi:hypothetical protein
VSIDLAIVPPAGRLPTAGEIRRAWGKGVIVRAKGGEALPDDESIAAHELYSTDIDGSLAVLVVDFEGETSIALSSPMSRGRADSLAIMAELATVIAEVTGGVVDTELSDRTFGTPLDRWRYTPSEFRRLATAHRSRL